MWHLYDDGHFWGMHMIWWGFWIIVIIVIFFTPWIFRPEKSGDSAMNVLQEIYACGEIDKEEFDERKRVLKEK